MVKLAISSSAIGSRIDMLDKLLIYPTRNFEVGFFLEESMSILRKFITDHNIQCGVHFPLPMKNEFHKLYFEPYSPSKEELLHQIAQDACKTAVELNAAYILFHLSWHSEQYIFEKIKEKDLAFLHSILRKQCEFLNKLATEVQIPILIENLAKIPPYSIGKFFAEIFADFPNLKLCLDVGHLANSLDVYNEEDFFELFGRLLPYTKVIHLYSAKNDNGSVDKFHHPIHPSQTPSNGWINIERVIKSILAQNQDITIVLEHAPNEQYTQDFIIEGVNWIKSLIDALHV